MKENTTNNQMKFLSWFLIVLLFTSVDTLLFGTNSNRVLLYVPRLMGALGIAFLPASLNGFKNVKIHIKDIFFLFTLTAIMSVSSLLNHENVVTYISRFITVWLGYTICHTISEIQFAKTFDRCMTIISCCALLTEAIAYISPNILSSLLNVTNSAGKLYYSWFFSSIYVQNNIGNPMIRASGIFWEPGAFAIYLIFALIIQLFILEQPNAKIVVLYLITLVFTFSTTGYVALAVLLLSFIVSKRSAKLSKKLKAFFIFLIIIIVTFAFFLENSQLSEMVFGKLTSGTSSATSRYSSIFNGFKVALDHPFFGVASQSQGYMSDYVNEAGNLYSNGGLIIANTIIAYTVSYGFIFGIIFTIGSIRFLLKYSSTVIEGIFLSLTLIFAYAGERFFSFLPFIFVFYGLMRERNSIHENSCD